MKHLFPSKKGAEQLPATRNDEGPFDAFRRQMDSLFDNFLEDFGGRSFFPAWSGGSALKSFNPKFDIAEAEDAWHITAEMPGMEQKDLDITLDNGALTIKGEKKQEKEEKHKEYFLSERGYGLFQRSFALPEGTDPENIKAEFKNGILKLDLPKTEKAKSNIRKIAIK